MEGQPGQPSVPQQPCQGPVHVRRWGSHRLYDAAGMRRITAPSAAGTGSARLELRPATFAGHPERVRFELTEDCSSAGFKPDPLNLSGTVLSLRKEQDSNLRELSPHAPSKRAPSTARTSFHRRKVRDSNPRTLSRLLFSRQAPSATRSTFQFILRCYRESNSGLRRDKPP